MATARKIAPAPSVLDEVESVLRRYLVLPSDEAYAATALWALHTHCMQAISTSPRIAFLSAEKGSGKTMCLDLLEILTHRPLKSATITGAALRALLTMEPTMLIDEVDAIFVAKNQSNETLRAILNAGYKRGAKTYIGRAGGAGATEAPCFAPVAFAGIGIQSLPETVLDRCILIGIQRKKASEVVEEFSEIDAAEELAYLPIKMAEWAERAHNAMTSTHRKPQMPDQLKNRAAEVWRPLLAIADLTGGRWPARARKAAVALQRPEEAMSLGVRLLRDVRACFNAQGATKLNTALLCGLLVEMQDDDGCMWSNINPVKLAILLKPYGIKPRNQRHGKTIVKGYHLDDFTDAFDRYLPAMPEAA